MRAECSANKVALVRTRSINEIKTKPMRERERERGETFLSLDCVIRAGQSRVGGLTVGSSTPADYVTPLFHPFTSLCVYYFARTCIITATSEISWILKERMRGVWWHVVQVEREGEEDWTKERKLLILSVTMLRLIIGAEKLEEISH